MLHLVCAECGIQYEMKTKGDGRWTVLAVSPALFEWQFGAAVPADLDSSPVREPPGSKEEDERAISSLKERASEKWHAMYEAGSSSPAYAQIEREWRALLGEITILEDRSTERSLARSRIDCGAEGHPLEPWPRVRARSRKGWVRELLTAVLPELTSEETYVETRSCRCRSRGETRHVVVKRETAERTIGKLGIEDGPPSEEFPCLGCGKPSLTSAWPTDFDEQAKTPDYYLRTPCPRCKQERVTYTGGVIT